MKFPPACESNTRCGQRFSYPAARRSGFYHRERILGVYEQELFRLAGKGQQAASEAGSARPLETVCS
jgi:hypothetical protein